MRNSEEEASDPSSIRGYSIEQSWGGGKNTIHLAVPPLCGIVSLFSHRETGLFRKSTSVLSHEIDERSSFGRGFVNFLKMDALRLRLTALVNLFRGEL
jgi:hypothetical protein